MRVPRSRISVVPALHAPLRSFQEAAVFLALQQGQQLAQDEPAVAHQTYVNRMAQPDARALEVDLNAFALPGLG